MANRISTEYEGRTMGELQQFEDGTINPIIQRNQQTADTVTDMTKEGYNKSFGYLSDNQLVAQPNLTFKDRSRQMLARALGMPADAMLTTDQLRQLRDAENAVGGAEKGKVTHIEGLKTAAMSEAEKAATSADPRGTLAAAVEGAIAELSKIKDRTKSDANRKRRDIQLNQARGLLQKIREGGDFVVSGQFRMSQPEGNQNLDTADKVAEFFAAGMNAGESMDIKNSTRNAASSYKPPQGNTEQIFQDALKAVQAGQNDGSPLHKAVKAFVDASSTKPPEAVAPPRTFGGFYGDPA